MKLVVGLGNPGRKYQGTRHNIGYEVVADLARRFGTGAARSSFQGEVVDASVQGERLILLSPHTFMNASGASVVAARDFYKLGHAELLVVCDDFNLPLARLRIRTKGSSGGQKGLEDIIRRLGGDDIGRLRIGIGQPADGWDAVDYVLGKFSKAERPEIEAAIWRAGEAVVVWARDGVEACMNQYN
jgi:peptidyl-tRNA hydrolase, PTH1 family